MYKPLNIWEKLYSGVIYVNRRTTFILASLLLVGCVGLGAALGKLGTRTSLNQAEKPVINAAEKEAVVRADTQVVFEQYYSKSQQTVISSFPDRDQLNGKGLKELQQVYGQTDGFEFEWSSNTLVIRQVINDWCPKDKEKLRLKEHQNRVAVFQGPDAEHDMLLEVTSIPVSSLPAEIRKKILDGAMEFSTREELNDALENLDEYL